MDKLVLLAPLMATVFLLWRGLSWTFIYFVIPLMIIVPSFLAMDLPGIPPLSFHTAAFLPFLVVPKFWETVFRRFHWLDLFVYSFILLMVLSELSNNSLAIARQQLFLYGLSFFCPYVAMKVVLLDGKMEREFGRMVALCMGLVGVYCLYTFRFGINHYLVIRNMWPYTEHLPGLAVWPRWGFFRASGPFMHPITAGIAYGFVMTTALWLYRSKANKFHWLDLGLFGAVSIGLVTTMSRGPYMGAFLALGVYFLGENRYRVQFFGVLGLLLIFLSVPGSFKTAEYFSATRATAATAEQETVMYRRDLILNYMEVIKKKPWLGYSFQMVPIVGDQDSIDNAYILIGLQWGVFAVLSMLCIFFCSAGCMIRLGIKEHLSRVDRGQMWGICGAMLGCAFSASTVAIVDPITSIIAIWAGWAAGLMVRNREGYYSDPGESGAGAETVDATNAGEQRKMIIL